MFLQPSYCYKIRGILVCLIKAVLKKTSNVITQHEESWLEWILVEQENYKLLHTYISGKKLSSHTFKASSSKEVILMHSEKIKIGRLTFSQFSEISSKWTLSNGYFTISRSSHSKAFIYLKSPKTVCEKAPVK